MLFFTRSVLFIAALDDLEEPLKCTASGPKINLTRLDSVLHIQQITSLVHLAFKRRAKQIF